MRKITVLMVLGVLAVSNIAAADEFMPRKLEISGHDIVYTDNGNKQIYVNVVGANATVYFAVFSANIYNNIINIQHNHTSWHYVNKIDTCVYLSPPYYLTEGEHYIEWDGLTSDDKPIRTANYYYYLWGIDTGSPKQLVSRDIPFPTGGGIIRTADNVGNVYTRPFFYPSADVYATGTDSVIVTRSRWKIGSDPLDTSAIEQTWYMGAPEWAERGPLAFSPYAPDVFFTTGYDLQQNRGMMRRFHWVTGGEAVWDESWGEHGKVLFSSVYSGQFIRDPGAVYIGEEEYISTAYTGTGDSLRTTLPVIDGEYGYILDTIKSQPWWQLNSDEIDRGVVAESMNFQVVNGHPSAIFGNHLDCLYRMINPQDVDGDYLRYGTDLGLTQEENAQGIPALDREGFGLLPGMGAHYSLGVLAPDGTWMGQVSFADGEGPVNAVLPVDYGSAYDGLYFDGPSTTDTGKTGLWYRGYDSFRGIIEYWDYSPHTIQIFAPNGGEVIQADSTYTIQAIHTMFPDDRLIIKYSLNNGVSWTTIDTLTAEYSVSYDWLVPNVSSGQCLIRIDWSRYNPFTQISYKGFDESNYPFSIVGPLDTAESQPLAFTIFPASPNPFNPLTAIEFILPEESPVRVTIYNTLGQRVERLQDGVLGAGSHRVIWDAAGFGPGLYFYRVETNADVKTGKMMLVK